MSLLPLNLPWTKLFQEKSGWRGEEEESKHSDSVFLQWDCAESAEKNTKSRETKTQITQNLKRYDLSWVVPCQRARAEDSENVVVFEI